jgi:hypothetical protein
MPRRLAVLPSILIVLSGCVANPGPSNPPGPSVTPEADRSALPTVEASSSAVPPSLDPASPPVDDIAWWGVQLETDSNDPVASHLTAGVIGQPASIDETVAWSDGPLEVSGAGGVIGVISRAAKKPSLVFWSVPDGRRLGDKLDATGISKVVIDPVRGVAYLAVAMKGGGAEIRRVALGGTNPANLIELDARFTPDGIPRERFDLAVDPDGTLLAEACAKRDGCRLWTVPAGAKTAPEPVTLAPSPPILCSIVGATTEWLVVYDDGACTADTSEAPLPIRAISRADGTSHLVADGHVGAGRIIEFEGGTYVVANDGAFAGATIDIVTLDVVSGTKVVHLKGIPPGPDDSWLEVSPQPLPSPWVLLQPVFIETTALPTIPARYLNLATGQVIELSMGTFGWR